MNINKNLYLDTDAEGNTGNVVAIGRIKGYYNANDI